MVKVDNFLEWLQDELVKAGDQKTIDFLAKTIKQYKEKELTLIRTDSTAL